MKKQLQGIAIILVSILLMIGFGNKPVFDFSFRWSAIFTIIGIVGTVMTFLHEKKEVNSNMSNRYTINTIAKQSLSQPVRLTAPFTQGSLRPLHRCIIKLPAQLPRRVCTGSYYFAKNVPLRTSRFWFGAFSLCSSFGGEECFLHEIHSRSKYQSCDDGALPEGPFGAENQG